MPVEIREIVIKTVIQTTDLSRGKVLSHDKVNVIKKEVLEERRRLIYEDKKKYKR